jgi:hypothetical protein
MQQLGVPPAAVNLSAYCLELTRQPPSPGTVFRLAGKELQQRFASVRSLMDASAKLRDLGLLHPDSDPVGYFHAIRQWAIWSEQEHLDLKGFGRAFVERTKKNLKDLGQGWSRQIEDAVWARVPGRWRDIEAVVRESKGLAHD